MNFASPTTLEAAARAHGFRSVAPDAAARFDVMLLRLARALLEPAGLVSSNRTLQPEHFASLRRIKALLVDGSDAVSRRSGRPPHAVLQLGGHAETVLPARFFDPRAAQVGGHSGTVLPGRYFDAAGVQVGGDGSAMIRPDMVSTFQRQAGGSGDGARAALSSTFPPAASLQSGGGSSWALPDDAMARLLREYRARVGDVRVSEAARRYLAAYLVRNADWVLREAARRSSGKAGARRLTGPGIDRAAAKWRIEL